VAYCVDRVKCHPKLFKCHSTYHWTFPPTIISCVNRGDFLSRNFGNPGGLPMAFGNPPLLPISANQVTPFHHLTLPNVVRELMAQSDNCDFSYNDYKSYKTRKFPNKSQNRHDIFPPLARLPLIVLFSFVFAFPHPSTEHLQK
jgi:hypothetical protein